MVQESDIVTVETEAEFVHVRFRDPDQFETIRTPDWAQRAASSVSEGSEVRTGHLPNSDDWEIQSVLIPNAVGESEARQQALEIVRENES